LQIEKISNCACHLRVRGDPFFGAYSALAKIARALRVCKMKDVAEQSCDIGLRERCKQNSSTRAAFKRVLA
jgi:hypothetical protein